jgi:hypothetical protein
MDGAVRGHEASPNVVHRRDAGSARHFIGDLAVRLKIRIKLTTDGHKAYINAVEDAFCDDVGYAMLVKLYGKHTTEDQRRYSPAPCTGIIAEIRRGNPEGKHISTSYV